MSRATKPRAADVALWVGDATAIAGDIATIGFAQCREITRKRFEAIAKLASCGLDSNGQPKVVAS